jgi:hypothetical protein
MERSVLARRTAPFAVFAAVLGGVVALSLRGPGADRRLDPVPLSVGAGARAEGATAPRDAAMYYGGEIVIPDRLLAGLPTEGPVSTVTRGDVSTARIAALARALGVDGEVRTVAGGWSVGAGDRVLQVMSQPGTPWYLGPDKGVIAEDSGGGSTGSGGSSGSVGTGIATAQPADAEPEPKPTATGDDTPVSSDPGEPDCKPTPDGSEVCAPATPVPCLAPDGAEPTCGPVEEPTHPPQPSDADARAVAEKVFDAAGVTGPTTVNDAWGAKEVVAAPVVGGLPTVGFETRVAVLLGGTVQYASGFLGGTEHDGDYPLLAPRDAVARGGAYGDPRILSAQVGAPCAPDAPCPTPAPREATGVRLGLLFMGSYDTEQGAFLAPAWLLTFDGSTWPEPVLALPDRYIATPPPATGEPPKPDDPPVDQGSIEPDFATGAPAEK